MSKSLGLVVPFDSALDREFWRYVPDGVDLYLARTPHVSGPLGVSLIEAVSEPDVVLAVASDLAAALDPDVVVYACTSGSFLRGLEACRRMTVDLEGVGCRGASSTSELLLAALETLQVGSLAVATPYDDALTELLVKFLQDAGFNVVSVRNLGMTGDPKTVPLEQVADLARSADDPAADAVFLSCTNLQTFDLVPTLERELGKPVLTANQVTMWGALRKAGLPAPDVNQRLFRAADRTGG